MTFELTEQGSAVLLTVTHRRLANRDEMLSVAGGWHTHLDILLDRLHDPGAAAVLEHPCPAGRRVPRPPVITSRPCA